MKPTEKQISYALYLLDKAGYSTQYMGSKFKDLGATMRERSGSVKDWLESLGKNGISKLIDSLK